MICKIFQTQTNKTNNLVTRVTNSIVSADSLVGDVGGLTQSNHQMFIKCFIKFLMLCIVRLKLIFEKYFRIYKRLEQLKLVVNWLTNKLLFSVDCKIKAILVENCLSFAVRHFLLTKNSSIEPLPSTFSYSTTTPLSLFTYYCCHHGH